MVALGQWTLEQACRDMASWRRQSVDCVPVKVSLKVARSQIAGADRLADQIWGALLAASLPPQCLQIELTEPQAVRDAAEVRRLVGQLGREGVHFALVEFGAGHGTLSILREVPFNVIEVDRSFAQQLQMGPEGLAVIGATLSLVRNLGKLSVAEGVDDAAQVAILQSLGCDCAAGPLFGEPLKFDAVAPLFAAPEGVGDERFPRHYFAGGTE